MKTINKVPTFKITQMIVREYYGKRVYEFTDTKGKIYRLKHVSDWGK